MQYIPEQFNLTCFRSNSSRICQKFRTVQQISSTSVPVGEFFQASSEIKVTSVNSSIHPFCFSARSKPCFGDYPTRFPLLNVYPTIYIPAVALGSCKKNDPLDLSMCSLETASKLSNMPLTVIVVGAGISGLCTAVALYQAGHSIKVKLSPNSLIVYI